MKMELPFPFFVAVASGIGGIFTGNQEPELIAVPAPDPEKIIVKPGC